jgi:hypothetical protein
MLRACQTASRLNADMPARQRDPVKQIEINSAALDVQMHYRQKAARRAEKEKSPLDRRRASTVAVRVSVTHIFTCHTPNKTVTVHLPTEAGFDDVQTLAERVCAAHCVDPDFAALCLETVVEELLDHADRLREDRAMKQPPKTMPQEMFDEYTSFGTIPVHQWWDDGTRAQSAVLGSSDPWPVSLIDALMHRVSMRQEGPNYPDVDVLLYELMDQVSHEAPRGSRFFDQASVVVVGTLVPWYEAVALYLGASNTMTIEYTTLHYRHPKMRSSTPDEYWAIDAAHRPRFDIGMSISSFEHDGLGRYGDPINPNGDLQSMSEMEEMLVPDGLLFICVPVGEDSVVWNLHRIYGRHRLSRLFARWTLLNAKGMWPGIFEDTRLFPDQPLFLLQNRRPDPPTSFLNWGLTG